MRINFLVTVVVLAICSVVSYAKIGYGPGEQDWGYVDVREGAHMFYWLYYTTADVQNYTERPLAIWLQGGPGASSTGYGNFEELGPLELEGTERSFTWVKDMNVLFIDNPVGSGFSYVDNAQYLTTTNNQIALDLVSLMKGFYQRHPEFESVPLHIFCESYGGKMAPEFALELYYAVQRGELRSNLRSVILGDPWTSPIDSVMAWAPMLLQMSIVDHEGYNKIMQAATKTKELVENGEWSLATKLWHTTQEVVRTTSNLVDMYNVLKPTRYDSSAKYPLKTASHKERTLLHYDIDEDRSKMLEDLMCGPVSEALEIPANVKWVFQNNSTFEWLSEDFMKPVIHIVNKLLDYTDVQVGVLSGQLDLICATPGTINWINKLDWSRKSTYEAATRNGISVNNILEGYEKSGGNFTMFWVNRAGHMVPADNPAAMGYILQKYTGFGLH